MKSHTDLPQSKKLAEFLPFESADMWWVYITAQGKRIAMMHEEPDPHYLARMESYGIKDAAIRCWSLGALLGYLNQNWYVYLSHDGICWQCVIDHHDRKERRCSSVLTDEPVDCCVELIVKLKEENLI